MSTTEKKSNPWIEHIKKYSKDHNISYKEAIKASHSTYVKKENSSNVIKPIDDEKPIEDEKPKLKRVPKLKKIVPTPIPTPEPIEEEDFDLELELVDEDDDTIPSIVHQRLIVEKSKNTTKKPKVTKVVKPKVKKEL